MPWAKVAACGVWEAGKAAEKLAMRLWDCPLHSSWSVGEEKNSWNVDFFYFFFLLALKTNGTVKTCWSNIVFIADHINTPEMVSAELNFSLGCGQSGEVTAPSAHPEGHTDWLLLHWLWPCLPKANLVLPRKAPQENERPMPSKRARSSLAAPLETDFVGTDNWGWHERKGWQPHTDSTCPPRSGLAEVLSQS